jgi:hypothetical protein
MHGAVEVSCQVLNGINKAGVLKPDADGYYDMIVGGLNITNNKGEYYDYNYGRKFFDEASDLVRMAKKAMLFGEQGHPKQGNLPDDKFIERLLMVEEKSICVHHRRIWLDFDRFKDNNGRPFVGIMSSLTPSGHYAEAHQRDLDNPNINVAYSIRCFSMPHRQGGRIVKEMKHVVTFDKVTEPGIQYATKYNNPTLESFDSKLFTHGRVLDAARNIRNAPGSNESTTLPVTALLSALGLEVRDSPQAKRNFMELLRTPKL